MRLAAIVIPLALFLSMASASQTPAPSSSPSDIEFTVKTRGEQTTFRIGEVIPFELSFVSTAPDKYRLDTANYVRSGRLNEEQFAVEPSTGWSDPLYRYFHAFQGFIGGGLRDFNPLSLKPTVIPIELNEWVQFNRPGRYRITVISGRVSVLSGPVGTAQRRLKSNELTLTILAASQQWQQQTLQHAVAVLDTTKPSAAPAAGQPNPSRDAAKTLRYLGTAEAAREMVRRLNDENVSADFRFGLVGSPAHDAALQAMQDALVAPQYPVTSDFLTTMSVVALPTEDSGNLPTQREQLEARFREDLIASLANKQGDALAASTQTIIEEAAIRSRPLPPDLKRKLTEQIVSNFDLLPVSKQAELLQYRWNALDQQAMLPLVRKVAQRYQDFPQLRLMNAYEYNNTSAAALQHWYAMDADGARPAMIQEMLRPRPRFDAKVLGGLPDKELPEVEQTLVQHLRASERYEVNSNLASLIYRYASPNVESAVIEQLDPQLGKMACAVQEPLLAYLIKVDPEAARPRLERAMEARGEGFSACNHSLLVEAGDLQNHPVLAELATKSLDDPDPEIAGNAADYLAKYGDASAEDVLWTHLIAWNQRWQGHEEQLRDGYKGGLDGVWIAGVGTNLIMALATGQAWLTDETKLRRLEQLSVTAQQRQETERYLSTWKARPWDINFIPIESGQFEIVQYHSPSLKSAEDKLKQFPGGTHFRWLGDSQLDGEEKAFDELSRFAVTHGIVIERQSQ